MEIFLYRRDVDLLAGPAAIGVRRGMQRLMNVADEMDQKREVAGRTPFVIIAVAKATCILVDFGGDTSFRAGTASLNPARYPACRYR